MHRLVTFGAALILAGAAHAQVYNCSGTYQQTPCSDGAGETVNLHGAGASNTTAENAQAAQARLDEYARKNRMAALAARGRVAVGMTAAEARRAWGAPDRINRDVGSYGTHEQWVYSGARGASGYIYLENGVVTSMQDRPGVPARRARAPCPSQHELRELEMAARSRIQGPREQAANQRRLDRALECRRQ